MSRGRKYIVPKNSAQIADAVHKAMYRHEFVPERPTFTDPRELALYGRIVKGCQIVAMMQAGEKVAPGWKDRLDALNVIMEGDRVRRWGYLHGAHFVRAYGHATNLRVADTHVWNHPEHPKGAKPEGLV